MNALRTIAGGLLLAITLTSAHAKVKVVATLTAYGAIAQEVGGPYVEVRSICPPNDDAHFVKPKPSYALLLREADLLVATGLDLELWLPALQDRSGNSRVQEGQSGYVAVAKGVPLLEKPASVSRAEGDIHIYGNPHIHTSPINAKLIARNILAGLKRVDPAHAAEYTQREKQFEQRMSEVLYGKQLVDLLGADVLDQLALQGKLIDFLKGKVYQGQPLLNRLGGWMKTLLPYRGAKIVTYHRSWSYFASVFGIQVAGYVEPKPGIPPTPGHVKEIIQLVQREGVPIIWAEGYFDPAKPRAIAQRTGAQAVMVALYPGGAPGVDTIFDLYNYWVTTMARELGRSS